MQKKRNRLRRIFKLINNEVIFGDIEVVKTKDGQSEILIKNPWIAKGGNMMPYMMDVMSEPIGAVQIHPMNIIWSAPLEEFKQANDLYIEKTTGIITDSKQKIII